MFSISQLAENNFSPWSGLKNQISIDQKQWTESEMKLKVKCLDFWTLD